MPVIQGTKKGNAKMKGSRLQKCSAGRKCVYVHTSVYVYHPSGGTTAGTQRPSLRPTEKGAFRACEQWVTPAW